MVCTRGDTRFYGAPPVLMLQLGRFQVRAGRVHKIHAQVQVNASIWVPLFMNANFQVMPIKYERIAAVCHHGDHPKSGHYQAILHSSSCCWDCDDRGSRRCDDVPIWYSTCCYLLVYKRVSDLTPGTLDDTIDHFRFPIQHA